MSLIAAFKWFFKVLREGEPASGAGAAPAPAAQPARPAAPPPPAFTHSAEPAIQMLALLQKEGRLLDFLLEDVSGYSDAEIGAAVRDIHAGCRKLVQDRVKLEPVLKEAEGAAITVPEGFDPSAISLTGAVSGRPPYKGTVRHRGWRIVEISLPTVPPKADPHIAAPAEVDAG